MARLKNGSIISEFTIIAYDCDDTWITNHMNGIIRTDGNYKEVTDIPFVNDELPRPDATAGLFITT
jgi:streptogramin lyase